jgi:hypothetical protein
MAKNLVFCVVVLQLCTKGDVKRSWHTTHPLVEKPDFATCRKWLKVSFASDQNGHKQHF